MTQPAPYNWPPQNHEDVRRKVEEIAASGAAFNPYRFNINGVWQKRGTVNPDIPRTWVKHDATLPNPPEGGEYFKTGVGGDIMLAAT